MPPQRPPAAKKRPGRRYAAFLRGVSPMNAKMADLQAAFEAGGFSDVKTVLSSGNVVFTAAPATNAALEQAAETAMHKQLGRTFATIVRPIDALAKLLSEDPFAAFALAPQAKRVVTFFRRPRRGKLTLPGPRDGAQILRATAGEAFTAYVASPRGPVFMTLIQATFGQEVTTRTWETIKKVVRAGGAGPAPV